VTHGRSLADVEVLGHDDPAVRLDQSGHAAQLPGAGRLGSCWPSVDNRPRRAKRMTASAGLRVATA
jgi:hypothetical protein